jgi:hypothetical protein
MSATWKSNVNGGSSVERTTWSMTTTVVNEEALEI